MSSEVGFEPSPIVTTGYSITGVGLITITAATGVWIIGATGVWITGVTTTGIVGVDGKVSSSVMTSLIHFIHLACRALALAPQAFLFLFHLWKLIFSWLNFYSFKNKAHFFNFAFKAWLKPEFLIFCILIFTFRYTPNRLKNMKTMKTKSFIFPFFYSRLLAGWMRVCFMGLEPICVLRIELRPELCIFFH